MPICRDADMFICGYIYSMGLYSVIRLFGYLDMCICRYAAMRICVYGDRVICFI